ncbi:GNAT family N-acetyltransferase [Trichlorobacter lovleyi]|uniref:GCN5-related N-acetyltransferase n=2 Tax=Trichlorobacter lovleyi TaxID=313985 RepID=B3E9F4_TRIL1|nr:GNAT family N-acetyltransferase [Trichlorobacter lovleyi]ACD93820.1 GCN5-related N-acetyltransferase [Trichlorobacter lovleyi SZ]
MQGMIVIPATAEDAAAILALQQAAYQSEAELYQDWSIPPLTQSLSELQQEIATITVLKACQGTRLVGSVRAVQQEDNSVAIGRLIVLPDLQGQGIGSSLMAAIEAAFPTASRFELFTGSLSLRNIRLYERLGYTVFARKQLSPQVELVFMEKRVSSKKER